MLSSMLNVFDSFLVFPSKVEQEALSKFITLNRWFVSWNFKKESSKFSLDNYNIEVLFLDWSESNNDLQNLFYFQEEYIKDEQRNLKKEYLHAQEEVKRIQSVPLVIGESENSFKTF